jgi:hypothetical protein
LRYIGNITTTPERRNLMLQRAMDYALKENLFESGYMKKMKEEGKKFIRYIMIEYLNSLGPASNIKTVEQFLTDISSKKTF